MKRLTRLICLAGSAAALALGVAPVSHAATAPPDGVKVAESVFESSDPEAAYEQLSSSDRLAFDATELPSSVTAVQHETSAAVDGGSLVSPAAAGAANFTGVFSVADNFKAEAKAGNTLYTWWQGTRVNVTKGKVTSVAVYNYGYETSTPGWRKDGISTASYNAGWEGRGLVHANFVLGVAGWDIQHTDNCGQIRVNGDGVHYAISTSCNLN